MDQEIFNWIKSGKPFKEGVDLYARLSGFEIPAILKHDNSLSRAKLLDLIKGVHEKGAVKSNFPAEKPKKKVFEKYSLEDFPEDLQKLGKERDWLWARRTELQLELKEVYYVKSGRKRKRPSSNKGYRICREIVTEIEPRLRWIWSELDFYRDNGQRKTPLQKLQTSEEFIAEAVLNMVSWVNITSKLRSAGKASSDRYKELNSKIQKARKWAEGVRLQ